MGDFVHLHVHSEYSLLDGANRIKQLPKIAKELGMDAISITDHGVMYGAIEFYKACKDEGIKPIIGCEVYVAPRSRFNKEAGIDNKYNHLILRAKNNEGYKNLSKMVSIGFTEGYYYKPRIDLETLEKYHEGLICCSACLGGSLPQAILDGNMEKAEEIALWHKDLFGEDYYIEIQANTLKEQALANPKLVQLARKLDISLVATNDAHYTKKEDAYNHEVLLCIQTGKKMSDMDRMRFETDDFYIKSPEEMKEFFSNFPDAIQNTVKIAEKCNVEFEFGHTILPNYEVPAEFETHYDYFKKLCEDGLIKRYGENVSKEIRDRMEYEVSVIQKMGYVDYFLIVWDFINWAKLNGIPVGPGRGSGAGSIVAYSIGITDIDPIKYNLLFERFLNPDRISMPDFDVDFCYERRQEVIDYVARKYGRDHVSQIITFGTMSARMVIRDVGRALDFPYSDTDKLAKMIPFEIHITIAKAMEQNRELKELYDNNEEIHKLLDIAMGLEGMPRQASTHACGVVITKDPVDSYVPLYVNEGAISTQYTMTILEQLGLLKMDFLGLRTLTVIQDAINLIKENRGIDVKFDEEMNDQKVYKLWGEGKSVGIFQFESAGMTNFMKELKPDSLEDIIAGVSLYRPGPMDQIPRYIKNKLNPEHAEYTHPALEPILKVTYGCMVYQEQVMQIFRDLAGYSLGRADLVRRAMGKKKLDVMAKEREIFIHGLKDENGNYAIDGAVRRGIDEVSANKIFDEMAEFAKYAFNKSHAAAYAVVSYQTAYLKAHYPAEFMAATMNSFLGNLDKIPEYIAECKLSNIEVLRPDINESYARFAVINGKIRFALASIKNVGEAAIETIVKERKENGRYKDFVDFLKRVESERVNKKCIESLIMAGAFDELEKDFTRRDLLYNFENILDSLNQERRNNIKNQVNIFDTFAGTEEVKDTSILLKKSGIDITKKEMLDMEKEMMGLYISGHPLDEYINQITKISTITTKDLSVEDETTEENDSNSIIEANVVAQKYDNTDQIICGIVSSVKTIYTKSNRQMAFLLIEDLYGQMEAVVFPNVYDKHSSTIKVGEVLEFSGKISIKEGELPKILVNNVKKINGYSKIYIKITGEVDEKEILDKVISNIYITEGNIPIYLYFEEKDEVKLLAKKWWTEIDEQLISTFIDMFGNDNVKLK